MMHINCVIKALACYQSPIRSKLCWLLRKISFSKRLKTDLVLPFITTQFAKINICYMSLLTRKEVML